LRLGGEFIELFDDNEISIVSDDMGDEETTERRGDEGTKGRGCDEGNDKSDSIWPRTSLQAQSYYRMLSMRKTLIRGVEQIF